MGKKVVESKPHQMRLRSEREDLLEEHPEWMTIFVEANGDGRAKGEANWELHLTFESVIYT